MAIFDERRKQIGARIVVDGVIPRWTSYENGYYVGGNWSINVKPEMGL